MGFISIFMYVLLNLINLEISDIFEVNSPSDQVNVNSNYFINHLILSQEEDDDIIPPRMWVMSQPETEEDDDIIPPRMWVVSQPETEEDDDIVPPRT